MPKNPEIMTHEELYASTRIIVGARYRFDYPEEFESIDAYSAHRGQIVSVLRACTESEADVILDRIDAADEFVTICDRMFKVRADDGWEGDAWESELV